MFDDKKSILFKLTFTLLLLAALSTNAQVDLGLSVEVYSDEVFDGNFFTSMINKNDFSDRYIVSFNKNERLNFQIKVPFEVLEVRPFNKEFLMVSTNIDNGTFLKIDKKLKQIATYQAIDLETDTHDWALFDNRNLLLVGFYFEKRDLTYLGGNPNAQVKQYVLQEIDTVLNKVVNEWDTADHFKIEESLIVNLNAANISHIHMNSIQIVNESYVLISSKNLCEATLIDWTSGEIIWRLGGLKNQFQFESDSLMFSGQHHVQLNENYLTLFDNGVLAYPNQSSAVTYSLNQDDLSALQVSRYYNKHNEFYLFMGAVHPLKNKHQVVCWGLRGSYQISEFNNLGNEIMTATFSTSDNYRINPAKWDINVFSVNDSIMTIEPDNSFYLKNQSEYKFLIEEIYSDNSNISVDYSRGFLVPTDSLMVSFASYQNSSVDEIVFNVKASYDDSIFVHQQIPLSYVLETIINSTNFLNEITCIKSANQIKLHSKSKPIIAVELFDMNGIVKKKERMNCNSCTIKLDESNSFGLQFLKLIFVDENYNILKFINE